MNNKTKKYFIMIGTVILLLILGTFIYNIIKEKEQRDFEKFQNSQQKEVTGTIMTYEELDEEIMEIANLLMENNITGNLSSGNISDDFAPDCVKQARKEVYYTCYNKGVTYYIIYTDIGWMILDGEE